MRDEIDSLGQTDRLTAVRLMAQALEILDRTGPIAAAISLSLAIDQAGGTAPAPAVEDRIFGCYG